MEEKEIYLRDYLKILIKHKWMVILVPVISVLITAIFLFAPGKTKEQPQVYEATVTIQNGFLQKPVIEKQEAIEIIKVYAGPLRREIQVEDIPNTLYLRISLKGENPDLIKENCERLSRKYIQYGNEIYKGLYKIYRNKIDILNQQKKILEDNIMEMHKAIQELSNITEITPLQIFDKTLGYQNNITDYRLQILNIESSISDIKLGLANARGFKEIDTINVVNCTVVTSSRFDKKVKLLISAVMGLIGGALLAIAIENWRL